MRNLPINYLRKIVMLFVIFLSIFITTACTEEDLLAEIIAENPTEEVVEENDDSNSDDENSNSGNENNTNPDTNVGDTIGEVSTTPCDFSLTDITANQTVSIDCKLDLDGATVTLPSNVTLEFNGGEIINGTVKFTGGVIDGKLLNYTLGVEGNVSLKETTFFFDPARWDIVQGETTSDIALANNQKLENLFNFTKSLGATTFQIDEFDAYFEVTKVTSTTTNQNFYPSLEAVNIPSDFHLVMTDNTHLRTYPNGAENGRLIAFREVSNSSITGGTLHGERDQHDYSNSHSGEGGNHLMEIIASNNISVNDVTFKDGSKGGLFINALNFTFQSNYKPSRNITINGCVFDNNRRMAVALTDGYDILFENNTFINTAQATASSDGGVVGFAINIEPVRKRDGAGNLVYYEKVEDVIIRNNTERGSRIGAFNIYAGHNVTIENNTLESKVGWSYASGARIKNNIFNASSETANTPAIHAGGEGDTVYDNQISNNTIEGYGVAIAAYHKDLKIYDNTIKNCITAIQLKKVADIEIYDNRIESTVNNSKAVSGHITWMNNIHIHNNIVDVKADPVYFVKVNEDASHSNYTIKVENNNFKSDKKITVSATSGLVYNSNISNTGIQFINVSNVVAQSNQIVTNNSHGIHIREINTNVSLKGNIITVPANSRFECIKNDSAGGSSVTIESNNQCETN